MARNVEELDDRIVAAIEAEIDRRGVDRDLAENGTGDESEFERAKARVGTGEVAELTGLDHKYVYRRLRVIESRGRLGATPRPSEKTVFFFPMTGEVLTLANYSDLTGLAARVKKVVNNTEIANRKAYTKADKKRLKAAYRAFLEKEKIGKSAQDKERIDSFRNRLFDKIDGSRDGKVKGAAGLQGFHPEECAWSPFDPPRDPIIPPHGG